MIIMGNEPLTKHGTPPAHTPPDLATLMVHWATWGMLHQDLFSYTMGPQRSQMFHTTPGETTKVIHADCSQFYASCGHWAGAKIFTDTDATGSLLVRGNHIADLAIAKPGDGIVWGPGSGEHIAMLTEKISTSDWWTIGFGHSPGAPNRVKVSDMTTWMVQHGYPGFRILRFVS